MNKKTTPHRSKLTRSGQGVRLLQVIKNYYRFLDADFVEGCLTVRRDPDFFKIYSLDDYEIDGIKIGGDSKDSLSLIISKKKIGDGVKLKVWRDDKELWLEAKLEKKQE